ncbi:hypothetical protein FGE12_19745 [Aggregicoccus sp. 17bor-14]|uniref:hypothetical protein n=1 Tax=Myxococcaceae TaxID=31 RepID=UPI00129C13EF|nr:MULTISPECIES: hypothetical protein [Myxococcaceae]MBF5044644.1 hypothetical protein [Simulacricoccus sp. 17bor-14]MRI90388.1 hypothetical protein [Aggregicoccus sp. 17bor-14]
MPFTRHDAVLQAVRALGRHASQLAEAPAAEQPGPALQSIREACLAALGMEFDVLTRFDARSVTGLFSHPEQVRILARLVDTQARVLHAHGEVARALADSLYAWQLLTASRARFGVGRDGHAADALHGALGGLPPLD